MALPENPPLAFGDFVIDFAGRRLLHDGEAVVLEPKAFDVLALLAGSPGRAFSRDEILSVVWGHRHVTPGVLNRIIVMLRHALGEDAHSARYLHTLHGVGYRFDLPVPPTDTDTPAEAATAAAEDGFHRRASDLARPPPSPRRWRWLVLALLAAAALVAAFQLSRPATAPRSRATPAPVPATAAPSLMVMPLKAIGGEGSARTIADGLSEELICSLARIDGLRVIAPESTRLLTRAGAPAGQAQGLGISHVLEGNLQQSGQQLRVRMRMVEAGTGRLLWARDFDGDATAALSLQRDIAEMVADSLSLKLGLSLPTAEGGDAEFQRRYLRARSLTMRQDLPPAESVEVAEQEFRELLRQRPDDARTHAWLAIALRIRAHQRPDLRQVLAEEAVHEATQALRLDPSRYEPYLVLAANDCRNHHWEQCMARLDHAAELAPGSIYVHMDRATALARLGYLKRAEVHAREILALDPVNPRASHLLARILDTRGQHEEAAQHFRHAGADAVYDHWFNAATRNDAATALQLAEDLDVSGTPDPKAIRLQPALVAVSHALADRARWPQALAELQRYERDNGGRLHVARLLAPDATTHAEALAGQLIAAQASGYSSPGLLLWTKDLAFLRRTPAFQAWLRDDGILAYWQEHGFPQQCRADGDDARCD